MCLCKVIKQTANGRCYVAKWKEIQRVGRKEHLQPTIVLPHAAMFAFGLLRRKQVLSRPVNDLALHANGHEGLKD